jgi:hypothetical protein
MQTFYSFFIVKGITNLEKKRDQSYNNLIVQSFNQNFQSSIYYKFE